MQFLNVAHVAVNRGIAELRGVRPVKYLPKSLRSDRTNYGLLPTERLDALPHHYSRKLTDHMDIYNIVGPPVRISFKYNCMWLSIIVQTHRFNVSTSLSKFDVSIVHFKSDPLSIILPQTSQ